MPEILKEYDRLHELAQFHPEDLCVQKALSDLKSSMLYAGGQYTAYINYYGIRT